ncbi:hypothetical protein C1H46_007392 [Malus baccata]|uniref:S1 motif domain-containing protein n=1 Tax=Malus baccata TaxID=106549 RepID=A0A540N7H3_MALBA|nr:hypothetical protein C1H46_007392 [Malus baccata]
MSVKAVIRAARSNSCNNNDKVVFTVHTSFLAVGYVLTTAVPFIAIQNIVMHLETWLDFPLDEEEDLGDFDIYDAQQEHVTVIEHLSSSDLETEISTQRELEYWEAATSMASHTSNLECQMYGMRYPDVDMAVMIQVKNITDIGAYVSLLEYNNIEGMILFSELSCRWIRSVSSLIKVGRIEPVMVLKVDKDGEDDEVTVMVESMFNH